jgi:hypothetical protein
MKKAPARGRGFLVLRDEARFQSRSHEPLGA